MNIKYPELREWYNNYKDLNKVPYHKFMRRVTRYNEQYDLAIKKIGRVKHPRAIKTVIDDNGRVCTVCNEYKNRCDYHRSVTGAKGYTCACRDCRNKAKQDYRLKTGYATDRELKKKKRTLQIGEIIALRDPIIYDGNPREEKLEVLDYKFKKGYLVRSLVTGEKKYISTMDNHNTKFKHSCVRYYRLNEYSNNIKEIPIKKIEKVSEFVGLP